MAALIRRKRHTMDALSSTSVKSRFYTNWVKGASSSLHRAQRLRISAANGTRITAESGRLGSTRAMTLGLIEFLAIILAAVALVPSGCISRHCRIKRWGRQPPSRFTPMGSLWDEIFEGQLPDTAEPFAGRDPSRGAMRSQTTVQMPLRSSLNTMPRCIAHQLSPTNTGRPQNMPRRRGFGSSSIQLHP